MIEPLLCMKWMAQTLRPDPFLADWVPGGFSELPGPGLPEPFGQVSGIGQLEDTLGLGAVRLEAQPHFQVVLWDHWPSYERMEEAAAHIDSLLHGQSATLPGYGDIIACWRAYATVGAQAERGEQVRFIRQVYYFEAIGN